MRMIGHGEERKGRKIQGRGLAQGKAQTWKFVGSVQQIGNKPPDGMERDFFFNKLLILE